MHDIEPDDGLDARLRSAAPRTPVADAVTDDGIARLVGVTRRASRPRRWRRLAAVGVTAGVVVAGAGAAAADGLLGWTWSPWAQDPDQSYTYTLPSGIECESRIGNVRHPDPEVTSAVHEVLSEDGILERVDIDGMLQIMRTEERVHVLSDGTEVDAGYGTGYYPDIDNEYQQAVGRAVSEYVMEELAERDIEMETGSWGGEAQCPGLESWLP
ncbi:hypothetical protein [Ruania halotolerans]|uniref:hypothetical protein n=1 Tax=Ruania halotolerans TaxID=2897773 RepID=UPI001E28C15F|nr:hypothetical protein [Ruania halotolerans]UFU06966.1 hypothetical protein LQF10_02305 [Ruania halotolerans]